MHTYLAVQKITSPWINTEKSTNQAPVVQKVDNSIHRIINHYPVDSVAC